MSDKIENDAGPDDANFDDFEQQSTLGDLWRNNPLVKIGIVVGAAAVIFIAILLFGGKEDKPLPSYVGGGREVSSPPGTEEASPAYVEAVQEQNEATVEEAIRTGESALPTPIEPPVGRLEVLQEEQEGEDPLQRWRKLQEERIRRELRNRSTVEPAPLPEPASKAEAVRAMADVMRQQMQVVLDAQGEVKIDSLVYTTPEKFKEEVADLTGGGGEFSEEMVADEELGEVESIIVPAGEIVYAQLLTEANSDVPGPILGQIVTGPLAGSRIIGTFEVQEEYLTLTFNTIVIDGIAHPMTAVALDPKTTLPGLATEVDHRYFKRVILPMAAAFIEGTAEAVANTGLTTITIEGDTVTSATEDADTEEEIASGIEEAGQELGDIIDDIASDIETLVRVERGTAMGIFLLEPIVEKEGI